MTKKQTENLPALPDFEDHSAHQIDGYYKPEVTGPVVGRLVDAITVNGKRGPRLVYLLRLGRPCKALTGKGRDAKAVDLAPGQIIGVGERHELKKLSYFVDSKPVTRITPLEKIDIGGEQTMWRFKLEFEKGARRGTPVVAQAAPQQSDEGGSTYDPSDDDIPF